MVTKESETFTPTEEQLLLFKWAEFGKGHAVEEAVAGSGKTTSIIQMLNYIDDTDPVLLCSFTTLAARQLADKVKAANFTNVQSSTLNSIGWQICRDSIRRVTLDKFKTGTILNLVLQDYTAGTNLDTRKLLKISSYSIERLVALLKAYVVPVNDTLPRAKYLSEYHSIDLCTGESDEANWIREKFYILVEDVYRRSINCMHMMNYDDQKFFPVFERMKTKAYKWIIVDEFQDCNLCDLLLIQRIQDCSNKYYGSGTCRLLFVGDRKQAIYLFRGSLSNAIDQVKERWDCESLTLTTNFRSGDAIIENAKKTNPVIRGPVPNPRGKGIVRDAKTEEFLEEVTPGDYVLCRTTAPMIKRCMDLIKKNVRAQVKGREIGEGLLRLMDKIIVEKMNTVREKIASSSSDLLELLTILPSYAAEMSEKLRTANRDDAALILEDSCEALVYFCTDAPCISAVVDRITQLFTDDQNGNVVLFLTGHKAKGLQNKRCYFLRADLCPHPMAKKEHEKEQEENLRYVIETRPEHELIYVIPTDDELKKSQRRE